MPDTNVILRPYVEADRPFVRELMARLVPAETASPRAPGALAAYLDRRATGETPDPAGTITLIAVDASTGDRLGMVAYRLEREYFAGHPQAYVDLLAVTEDAAGRGVGYALMRHVEDWAIAEDCHELALDAFASNTTALKFYDRFGLRPDHLRLAKPLPAAGGVSRDAGAAPEAGHDTHSHPNV